MKKAQSINLVVGLILAIGLTGCAMFTSPERPGYQEGRTFVFVDTITAPFQPADVGKVIDQVYVLAGMDLSAESFTDELVKGEIDKLYKDATPEARQMIFNVYMAMRNRLLSDINVNPDIPKPVVIDNFFAGVRDALSIYQPKE